MAQATDETAKPPSLARLEVAKNGIAFLRDDQRMLGEFWTLWAESIPPPDPGYPLPTFDVCISAGMDKVSWRMCGPQSSLIQRMVDFFWNVGAPESEIDRLGDVGGSINPVIIGTWIDISDKGGMDGGWLFPVDTPIKLALNACDAGDALDKLTAWTETNGISRCVSVGRDMGAAPPRQTEITLQLPGDTFDEQLQMALSAFSEFGFPPIPDEVLEIFRRSCHPAFMNTGLTISGLSLTIITTADGFARISLVIHDPSKETVSALCNANSGGSEHQIANFENWVGANGPDRLEFQYLNHGYGYEVYKEGFDLSFHYKIV